jgi:hypothetical protein
LTGRTDIEIEISNQCARLIANAIIYYNSAILSRLLTKYEASGNAKALRLVKKLVGSGLAPHLNGHYTFRSDGQLSDLGCDCGGVGAGVTEFFRGLTLTVPRHPQKPEARTSCKIRAFIRIGFRRQFVMR